MLDLPIERRIGVSTHFMPSIHGEDLFDGIEAARAAGFAGFELVPSEDQGQMGFPHNAFDVGVDLLDASDGTLDRLREALSAFDWVTVHAPHLDWNLSSANRHLRRLTWQYYDRCFDFALEIGAVAVTYHSGGATWGFIRPGEDAYRYGLEYAEHLMEKARAHNMPVGFEAGGLDLLKHVCDRVEGWGINLDIGHAYMSARSDEGFSAYLDELGDKIVEIHHNGVCHYWNGFAEHLPVQLNNTIDYQRTYDRLKALEYGGPIICEIMGPDLAEVMRNCRQAKEMIVGLWNGTVRLEQRWYAGDTERPLAT